MRRLTLVLLILICQELFSYPYSTLQHSDWGFFAHRLLNKLAIFTLPDRMMEFYKANADYLYEHAVDPDKRRYAIIGEAVRHYIDLDQWGSNAIDRLPPTLEEAIALSSPIYYINANDTTLIFDTTTVIDFGSKQLQYSNEFKTKFVSYTDVIPLGKISLWLNRNAMQLFDEREWIISGPALQEFHKEFNITEGKILIQDRFSKHGVLPYSLSFFYNRLVAAFKEKNEDKILKLSADIGHYIGDAHVPLHTTLNYNGQLTQQDGIHAFWESRIPELFAEEEYNFVVGPAYYIENIPAFIRQTIKKSHSYVDSVLIIEKRISQQVPSDQQFCFEPRLGQVVKIQCRSYASLYNNLLDDQIEEQFRSCILAIGSIWMSAWTDAGQPELSQLIKEKNFRQFTSTDSLHLDSYQGDIRTHE